MNWPTKAPKHATKFLTHFRNSFCLEANTRIEINNICCFSLKALTMLSSRYQGKAVNALGLLCLMLLVQKSGALQFAIGGEKGWGVPSNDSMNYNQWAERTRFLPGDSVLFVYKPGQDSMLQVSKEDYENCNTASPIAKYDDGHSVFTFNKSGAHYFISGNKDNCVKNEKVIIVVMADRSNHSSSKTATNATSPEASPPSPESTGMVPAPTPAGEASPPTGSLENNPTPSPAGTPPKGKNAASSMFTSFNGIIGAVFATSSLALVL